MEINLGSRSIRRPKASDRLADALGSRMNAAKNHAQSAKVKSPISSRQGDEDGGAFDEFTETASIPALGMLMESGGDGIIMEKS